MQSCLCACTEEECVTQVEMEQESLVHVGGKSSDKEIHSPNIKAIQHLLSFVGCCICYSGALEKYQGVMCYKKGFMFQFYVAENI